MATISATCIKSGRSDLFGRPIVLGVTYPSLDFDLAKSLWMSGHVSVADPSVFQSKPYVASELQSLGVEVPIFRGCMVFAIFNGLTFTGGGGGAFTLAAPLMTSIDNIGRLLVYIPADAGGSGCDAAWYYAAMSTSTTGVVFNEKYSPTSKNKPVWPDVVTTFLGSPTGAVTQETSAITAVSLTIPGGSIGPNGRLIVNRKFMGTSSANQKESRISINGNPSHYMSWTTSANQTGDVVVCALGSQRSQMITRWQIMEGQISAAAASAGDILSENLEVDATLELSLRSNTNSDSVAMQIRHVSIAYGG